MLSTPPAFILSQDQTLMFEFLNPFQNNNQLLSSRFTFLGFVLENLLFPHLTNLWFARCEYSWIFGIVLLFNYQCSLLRRRSFLSSNSFSLSCFVLFVKHFFYFFKFLFLNPFQTEAETVHQKSFVLLFLSDSFHIIPPYFKDVNSFWQIFYFFLIFLIFRLFNTFINILLTS